MQIYEHIQHPCTTLHLTGRAPKPPKVNASDRRATLTFEDAEAVLHEAVQIQQHLAAQDMVLQQLIAEARAATAGAVSGAGTAGATGTASA